MFSKIQFKFQSTDELFNRHLETVKNEQEEEEFNKVNLDDEKDEDQHVEDEPKVFQDEEVLEEISNEPLILKKAEQLKKSKFTSVMPTPMAYSRSSSLTSLNSFDIKSIHSTVESEYSHVPKLSGETSQFLDDDLEDLLPESPVAPDSSFLKAQRNIHKINQAKIRNNSWNNPKDLTSVITKLIITEPKTPTANLPKFLQSNHTAVSQPQIAYGFLKNSQSKFLSENIMEDFPKVYSSIRLKSDSPKESICSRMSDASLPSLIGQDTNLSKNKFNSVLNSNPSFKALFDKLNIAKTENSSSSSSCSSVMQKLSEEENEQTKILDVEKIPDDCLYIDLDLENFIKENFQPNTESSLPNKSKVSLIKNNHDLTKRMNSKTPVVNMTKTAQLRASKLTHKVVENKSVISSPRINKIVKSVGTNFKEDLKKDDKKDTKKPVLSNINCVNTNRITNKLNKLSIIETSKISKCPPKNTCKTSK